MTYNVGLRIFHSNAKKSDYVLFRKEIEETLFAQNRVVLGKLSKDGRTVKRDCKNSNIKYEYLSDNVNRKEKMKYGALPDSIRLFNSTGDGKTYLLTKDKSGQVRFYQQTAPNHFEFVSSKKSVYKGSSYEKLYADGRHILYPKPQSVGYEFRFSDGKSFISGITSVKDYSLKELTNIEGNIESLRVKFANNYHLKKILKSISSKTVIKDSFENILTFLMKIK